MPNYQIALAGRDPEVETLDKAHARVASMRAMMQENAIRTMQMDAAKTAAAQKQREIEDDAKARGVYAQHVGPDGQLDEAGTLADLYKGGYTKQAGALHTQIETDAKNAIERRKLQLEHDMKRIDLLSKAAGAVRAVTDEAAKPGEWARQRVFLLQAGEDPATLPEQYDPNFIESGYQRSIEAKERATLEATALRDLETKEQHKRANQLSRDNAKLQADTSAANAKLQSETSAANAKLQATTSENNSKRSTSATIEAAKLRGAAGTNAAGGVGILTADDLKAEGIRYAITGEMSPLGNGSGAAKQGIIHYAQEYARASGLSPARSSAREIGL